MNTIGDIKKEVEAFRDNEIVHSVHDAVVQEVELIVENPGRKAFFMLFGPPGAGKSTVRRSVVSSAHARLFATGNYGEGHMPVVSILAPPFKGRRPDWKEFFSLIIDATNGLKEGFAVSGKPSVGFDGDVFDSRKFAARDLRRTAFAGLAARKTQLLVVDEAQQLLLGLDRCEIVKELDVLKSMTESTGILIGMIGTYDLLPLISASGQLSRRVHPVHYSRYRETEAGRKGFAESMAAFRSLMPLPQESLDLLTEQESMIRQSAVGCVGTASEILSDVLWRSLRVGGGKCSLGIIKTAVLTAGCSRTIDGEIKRGEKQWLDLLRGNPSLEAANPVVDENRGVGFKRKAGRIGRTNPRHDPVGDGSLPSEAGPEDGVTGEVLASVGGEE